MPEIQDTGKVWIKGRAGTEFAVKVDEKVFVPGQMEGQEMDCWLGLRGLCVDLHDPSAPSRIARLFPYTAAPHLPATLFNGFTQTKHGDLLVVTSAAQGILEKKYEGNSYRENGIGSMDARAFWEFCGLE